MTHIHLIGVGGSGLSAIARVLHESGYTVSGSDRVDTPLAQSLRASGLRINIGHDARNISGADLIVRSSAIPDNNPEVLAALKAGIPVKKRSEFLGQIMSNKEVIAIAGTHGKTTTTAMIAWSLISMGQDPSYIIGGVSKNLLGNAHAGIGQYFVIEADEYDDMFLGLQPKVIVITNCEHDHPDFFITPADYHHAFVTFTKTILPGGSIFFCLDNPGSASLVKEAPSGISVWTFGLNNNANYVARDILLNKSNCYEYSAWFSSDLKSDQHSLLARISLNIPGKHNIQNSLAALAVLHQCGFSAQETAIILEKFCGTERRFEILGEAGKVKFIDDYAHHPSEIRTTLQAARDLFPKRRVWAVWQPHTYSRTLTLLEEFLTSFDQADKVIVTEIYAAREKVQDYSSLSIVKRMNLPGAYFAPDLDAVENILLDNLLPGDVVITLSAGDANMVSYHLLERLTESGNLIRDGD